MNIFEDLIEELKEENLLETTVIETSQTKDSNAAKKNAAQIQESAERKKQSEADQIAEILKKKTDEIEFYRRRMKDEVSFLQMVEYVFAGVEREQLKTVPNPYDDLEVRKILHTFLQSADDPQSPEHAAMQFRLLQETQKWHSSLAARDERFLTANLRRYCETSRPPLGLPALISLARFYRNSTFSEPVRSKFDLILTRLFSKDTGEGKREMLFSREDVASRLTGYYTDWSSVRLYAAEADNTELRMIAEEFESLVAEADNAESFDELIGSDFFNRLHRFKSSTNTNFFAPSVVALAVESNILIGNRYVALLEIEKENGDVSELAKKYGLVHAQAISEAVGKTFILNETAYQKAAAPTFEEDFEDEDVLIVNENRTESPIVEKSEESDVSAQSNKHFLLMSAGAIVVLLILYFLLF